MSTFVFANFFQSTLAAAVTSSQTTISVASASGVPTISTGQQWAIVVQSASTQTAREVMYVTAISGTTLTVTRGQEGTSAQTWSIGDNVFGGNTAGQMGALVQQDGTPIYAADTGATNALMIFLNPAPSAYVAGLTVRVKVANTNTGAATLNVNALGAVSIVNPDGAPVGAGQLVAGAIVEATYDGIFFKLLGGAIEVSGRQAFLSSTTFTVPDGVTELFSRVWGGGAGGAGSSSTSFCGGGGGGGGYTERRFAVTPGAQIPITVGAGGSPANNGGTSSVGSYCSATGGATGTTGSSTSGGGGGIGGTGTGGDFNFAGQSGGLSVQLSSYLTNAGQGGGSFGTPSALYAVALIGTASASPGGVFPGGGGSGANGGTPGSGGNGLIIMEW